MVRRDRDRAAGGSRTYSVNTGPGCTRLLSHLRETSRGGLGCPVDNERNSSPSLSTGTSSTWEMRLWPESGGGEEENDGAQGGRHLNWQAAIQKSYMRSDAATLMKGYHTWFGCGREGREPRCDQAACPDCWAQSSGDAGGLAITRLKGWRYWRNAPRVESSGTGRWRGGDVQTAGKAGAEHGWALGEGRGEDVEIYVTPRAAANRSVGVGNITMARILYFFGHVANSRPDGGSPPATQWVAIYDYVSTAPGNGTSFHHDSATQHPI
ncbi:unnamed protein product [Sphacelaria rigidula]